MTIVQKIHYILLALVLHPSILPIHALPLISNITLKDNCIIIKPHPTFKKKYLNDDFFISYKKEDVDINKITPSTLIMPFLMNVIPLIWLSGEIWEIDEIDRSLFESLLLLKKIFTHIYPRARWNGMLKVHNLVDNTIEVPETDTIAMPFSGGLDSIHTSLHHAHAHQILITVREHQGYINNIQWHEARHNITKFAQHFNHETVFVASNYQRFIKETKLFAGTPGLGKATSHGLGWVGIATPVLMAKKCTHLKIASSISWDYPYPKLLCPMVDDHIKFANITVAHDGFDCTRVEKMDMVLPFFKNTNRPCIIYVCQASKNGTNCCACEKCIRTIGALLALGQTSFTDYGFNITQERAQSLIKKAASFWATTKPWRLEAMQEKIKAKKLEPMSPFLAWLAAVKINPRAPEIDYHHLAKVVSRLKNNSTSPPITVILGGD